jgi:[acyl-carrier-protein] S-malonyltransferase
MQRLASEGATSFIEVGPGRVLTALVKRVVDGARGVSIEDPDGLERVLEPGTGA